MENRADEVKETATCGRAPEVECGLLNPTECVIHKDTRQGTERAARVRQWRELTTV